MADEKQFHNNLPISGGPVKTFASLRAEKRPDLVEKLIKEHGFTREELNQLLPEELGGLMEAVSLFGLTETLELIQGSLKGVLALKLPEGVCIITLARLADLARCGMTFDLFANVNPPELRSCLLENAGSLMVLNDAGVPIEPLLENEAHSEEFITHASDLYLLICELYIPVELILNLEPRSRAWLFEHCAELKQFILCSKQGELQQSLWHFREGLERFFKGIHIDDLNAKLFEFWNRADRAAFNEGISECLRAYQAVAQEKWFPDERALGQLIVNGCALVAQVLGVEMDLDAIQQQFKSAMSQDSEDDEASDEEAQASGSPRAGGGR